MMVCVPLGALKSAIWLDWVSPGPDPGPDPGQPRVTRGPDLGHPWVKPGSARFL